MTTFLTQKDIESYIPHRYENMLIDSITIMTDDSKDLGFPGELEVTINKKDALGREIFTKEKNNNSKVIISSTFLEILALGSVVSTGKIPPDYIALFASISHFKKVKDIEVGNRLIGKLTPLKIKTEFFLYRAELFNDKKEPIASGDLMAFIGKKGDLLSDKDFEKRLLPQNKFKDIKLPIFNQAKDKVMFLLDKLVYLNESEKIVISQYTYPNNHPCTKGHFYNYPVMMGIMQILMVEDAAFSYALLQNEKEQQDKEYILCCNAEIIKENLVPVADLKGVKIRISIQNKQKFIVEADLFSFTKVAFRNMVSPGEVIYAKLTNITIGGQ
ncbi:MAG: hypothetical protein WC860_00055 [Candidatus Margulisiibacteriota bacterium]